MYGGKLEGKDVQTMAPFQFFKHLDKLFETWSYKTLVERIDISCKSTCFESYFFKILPTFILPITKYLQKTHCEGE